MPKTDPDDLLWAAWSRVKAGCEADGSYAQEDLGALVDTTDQLPVTGSWDDGA